MQYDTAHETYISQDSAGWCAAIEMSQCFDFCIYNNWKDWDNYVFFDQFVKAVCQAVVVAGCMIQCMTLLYETMYDDVHDIAYDAVCKHNISQCLDVFFVFFDVMWHAALCCVHQLRYNNVSPRQCIRQCM
jgi:acyl carrier protein phosphodiesterase